MAFFNTLAYVKQTTPHTPDTPGASDRADAGAGAGTDAGAGAIASANAGNCADARAGAEGGAGL